MIGLDMRSTMDIDAAIKSLSLSEDTIIKVVDEVCKIPLDDDMLFIIKGVESTRDDDDYSGVRVLMEASLERVRIPMKIDFSTDDVMTPHEVSFEMPLLLEDRTISIMAYNIETLLAEKLETVVARGVANTRMRDFYDLYVIENTQVVLMDTILLHEAFASTCKKRNTPIDRKTIDLILDEIGASLEMHDLWKRYCSKFEYATGIEWANTLAAVKRLVDMVKV